MKKLKGKKDRSWLYRKYCFSRSLSRLISVILTSYLIFSCATMSVSYDSFVGRENIITGNAQIEIKFNSIAKELNNSTSLGSIRNSIKQDMSNNIYSMSGEDIIVEITVEKLSGKTKDVYGQYVAYSGLGLWVLGYATESTARMVIGSLAGIASVFMQRSRTDIESNISMVIRKDGMILGRYRGTGESSGKGYWIGGDENKDLYASALKMAMEDIKEQVISDQSRINLAINQSLQERSPVETPREPQDYPVTVSISIEQNIPQASQSNPDGVAVIIGNRAYRNAPDVDFALRDAALTRRYVEQALGFRPGNILHVENATLTDLRVFFGDDRNPQGRLSDLVRTDRNDVFVFYSGHGAPDPNTNTAYLMPVDGDADRLALTGYPLDVLYENLGKLKARSVTVVIDACFSGATGAGDMLISQASPIGITIRNPAAQIPHGVVITASSGNQIASWHPEKRYGLLTYFFLKGLQGDADLDGDGRITAGEMQRYLQDSNYGVPYWARRLHGREQIPQVWGSSEIVIRKN